MQPILEIFIITYNRAIFLERTLLQLENSPFAQFQITILDNCSTDNTQQIYEAHQNKFPKLEYIKHKINIGGDANNLRAVELSNSEYTWILCDDDDYDFSDCEDVLEILEKREVDTIFVSKVDKDQKYLPETFGTPKELIEKGFSYFGISTFVPAVIFRTSIYQKILPQGYANINLMFPQLIYCVNIFNHNKLVYISKKSLLYAGDVIIKSYNYFNFKKGFISILSELNNAKLKEQSYFLYNSNNSKIKSLFKLGILYNCSASTVVDKILLIRFFSFPANIFFIIFFILSYPFLYIPLPNSVLMKKIKKGGENISTNKYTTIIRVLDLLNTHKITFK